MRVTEAHYTNITPMAERREACKAALEICLSEIIGNPPRVKAFFTSVRFALEGWEFTVEFGKPYCQITKAEGSEIHHIYDDGVIAYATYDKQLEADPFNVETEDIATGQDWDDVVPEIMAEIARERAVRECGTLRNNDPAPVGFEEVVN